MLDSLPLDIFYKILEFTSLNNLLISSKKFSHLVYHLYFWDLSHTESTIFVSNSLFRKQILGCMDNPYKQLSLDLDFYKFSKRNLKNIRNILQAHTLYLSYTNIVDISKFTKSTNIIARYTNISDISNLRIKKIDITCTHVQDISSLKHSTDVSISGCQYINDVSILTNVRFIDISFCNNISDVSMLGNAIYLNLTGCLSITDISALGNVKFLRLKGCTSIIDFSPLTNNESLDLRRTKIRDLSIFRNNTRLEYIDLDFIDNLRGLRYISHIKNVHFGMNEINTWELINYRLYRFMYLIKRIYRGNKLIR